MTRSVQKIRPASDVQSWAQAAVGRIGLRERVGALHVSIDAAASSMGRAPDFGHERIVFQRGLVYSSRREGDAT